MSVVLAGASLTTSKHKIKHPVRWHKIPAPLLNEFERLLRETDLTAKECAQLAGGFYSCGGKPSEVIRRTRTYLNAGKSEWIDVATGTIRQSKPRPRKNITGRRFGRLLVLGVHAHSAVNNAGTVWLCRCDCGRTKTATVTSLNTGGTRSCGCLSLENRERISRKLTERSIRPNGEAAFMRLVRNYINSAKERGVEFALSHDEFRRLTQSDCFYCGLKPAQTVKSGSKAMNGNYLHNGIDRLDSNAGYEGSNCVPCCITCNRAKHILSLDEFCDWIERLTTFRKTASVRQSIDELKQVGSL